jgi:hypothetical protein
MADTKYKYGAGWFWIEAVMPISTWMVSRGKKSLSNGRIHVVTLKKDLKSC